MTVFEVPTWHYDRVAEEAGHASPLTSVVLARMAQSATQLPAEIDWATVCDEIIDPAVTYPEYYLQPVHSMPGGYLSPAPAIGDRAALDAIYADDHPDASLGVRGLVARLFPTDARTVVSLGCGTGDDAAAIAQRLPDADVTGIDLSPYMLAVGRSRYAELTNLTFRHADAIATGLETGSVDAVNITLVLHECSDDAKADLLAEARRILHPDGVLVVTDTMHDRLDDYRGFYEPYRAEWQAIDLDKVLATAGFRVLAQPALVDTLWTRIAVPH